MTDRRIKSAHVEANEENIKKYQEFLDSQNSNPLNSGKNTNMRQSVEAGGLGGVKKTIDIAESFEID